MAQPPRRHIPALDGLRGVAVLSVLLFHALMDAQPIAPVARMGWVGVELFFVLSGLLITGILVDDRGTARFFRNFYIRRALRIWPLYLLLLGFGALVVPRLGGLPPTGPVRAWLPWSLLFLQNLALDGFGPWPIAVTWSLAIEDRAGV